MLNPSLTSRKKYLENYIQRLSRISNLTPKHLKANPKSIPFYEIIKEYKLWINKEQQVRSAMRILVYKWLQRKYGNRILNDHDPWTLYPPKNIVSIFDAKSRGIYQFEASSLRHHIETGLGYSQWLFSSPYAPKNPLTNIEFHEGQRITILNGLRKHGYGSWMIEAYKICNWNLKTFRLDNSIQLSLYAINQIIKNPNEELYDMLEDFIEEQYDENKIKKRKALIVVIWAVREMINTEYMKKWVKLFHDYYKIKFRYHIETTNNIILRSIYVRSLQLFDDNASISVLANKRHLEISKQIKIITMPATFNYPSLLEHLQEIEIQGILNEIVSQIIDEPALDINEIMLPIEILSSENNMAE